MLEKFEIIYSTNKKANDEDWKILFDWLTENNFPNTVFPESYVLLMSESNGGDYISGEREYQFLSLKEATEYYEAYMFSKFMPFALAKQSEYNDFFIRLKVIIWDEIHISRC